MEVTVHDVGHGLCISLVHENGNVMLWDCGRDGDRRPSRFLRSKGITRIDRFFVTNYDEDHISDLPALREGLYLPTLHRNDSISAAQLQVLKSAAGPLSEAMQSMLDMIGTYTGGPPEPPPAFPRATFRVFYNQYGMDFNDTNNLSLVTFLQCGANRFIFPGDLEVAGWRRLLARPDFQRELSEVNVFVASHHGRETGYCREVFSYSKPNVIVFSDSPIQYATQEMANTYAAHVKGGVPFNGHVRKVLTTRNDGSLTWTV